MPEITKPRGLRIGDASRVTGLHIETIRYYERIGLVAETERSRGGYRIYSPDHIRRLSFIRRARELGFAMDEIRTLGDLMHDDRPACADVQMVASRHLADIRRKIADMQRIEATLDGLVAKCGRGDRSDCAVIDALTVAPGKTAAGAS